MATFAPSCAKRIAIDCPMPDDAHVINTFLPWSLFMFASFANIHPPRERIYSVPQFEALHLFMTHNATRRLI